MMLTGSWEREDVAGSEQQQTAGRKRDLGRSASGSELVLTPSPGHSTAHHGMICSLIRED